MKYIANPVEVNAYKIVEVRPYGSEVHCVLDTGIVAIADARMTSRYTPIPGDYWVRQSDGYEYLNPKDVFERKYHAAPADSL